MPSDPEDHPALKRLINRRQLRELIPVSDMSIWRWTKAGIFPEPIKILGRNYWPLMKSIGSLRAANDALQPAVYACIPDP